MKLLKKFSALVATLLLQTPFANAAEIVSGEFDLSGRYLTLDVVTGGGCGAHYFTLNMGGGCLETFPVQCSFNLIEKTNDACEALISGKAVIDLADVGIYANAYYSQASITIVGDPGSAGKPSTFSFQMPKTTDFNPGVDICTADVNKWGNPSACGCSDERATKYNEQTGNCEL